MLIEKKINEKITTNTVYVCSKTHQGQFDIYNHRLNYLRLRWCKKVKNILKKNYKFSNKLKINDIGCAFTPFYKELKISKLKSNYVGYDHDKDILNLACKKYPELKKKLFLTNIENCRKIRIADITIISSLLEHLKRPKKVLNYLIKKTKKCLILRVPLSNRNSVNLLKIKKREAFWIFSIFKKKEILKILKKNQFTTVVHENLDGEKGGGVIGSTKLIERCKRKIIIIEAKKINEI